MKTTMKKTARKKAPSNIIQGNFGKMQKSSTDAPVEVEQPEIKTATVGYSQYGFLKGDVLLYKINFNEDEITPGKFYLANGEDGLLAICAWVPRDEIIGIVVAFQREISYDY